MSGGSVYSVLNDHNYLDITIKGDPIISPDTTSLIKAEYRETRTAPLLEIPSEWELGIARFSVPSNNIPIFNFLTDTYRITFVYPDDDMDILVQYIPDTRDDPYIGNPIYTYSQFIQCINKAFSDLFILFKLAHPGFPAVNPPVLKYNSATKIVSLYAEHSFNTDTSVSPTNAWIAFNNVLIKFFPGLQQSRISPFGSRVIVTQRVDNDITYLGQPTYVMDSDYQDVLNWDQIYQVIIKTTGVPIIPEQKAIGNNQNSVFQSILTDFNFAGTGFRESGRLLFYNQGNIRWYDMISDHPLTSFDLVFEFSNLAGDTFPIYISAGDSANIKIEFKKKGVEITD